MRFTRIQFTPDLMPSDVTGSSIWNQRDGDFEFRPGPIFTNLLLADEINRAPPKTQAALLEAMQERQVTIEGVTHRPRAALPRHRDAEPDRVRGHVPAARGAARSLPPAHGVRLPEPRGRGGRPRAPHRARVGRRRAPPGRRPRDAPRDAARHRARVRRESVQEYCVDLVAATRASPSTAVGASPRGSLALLKLARCRAALAGPRLRAPGRRQGDRGSGARPPPRPPPGALGAARLVRGRRPGGARDRSDAAGGGRHGRATRVTRTASPRLDRLRVARCRRPGRRARAPPARARCRRRAVRAAPRDRHAHGAGAAHLGRARAGRPSDALEGTEVGRRRDRRDRSADRPARAPPRLPRGVDVAEGSTGARAASPSRRDAASSHVGLRCARWGVFDLGRRSRFALATRSGSSPGRRASSDTQRLKAYPSPLTHPAAPRAARDAGVRGKRGRAREGRRRRVRGYPRLRSRRSRPLDQLARVGTPPGPRRERAPSGAQHGRRAVRRQLRGRSRRWPERARGRRPGRRVARHPLPRAARPRRTRRRSAACCAGSSPEWARPSATGSSRRCSRRASRRRTRGATSTSSPPGSSRRPRSCSR